MERLIRKIGKEGFGDGLGCWKQLYFDEDESQTPEEDEDLPGKARLNTRDSRYFDESNLDIEDSGIMCPPVSGLILKV